MTKPIVLNRGRAKTQPETAFADPKEVVDHVLLTYAEKRTVLERWRTNILSELAAAGDGTRTDAMSDGRRRVLGAVEAARHDLERARRERIT
ncbi:MAG: hypothetical protein NW223_03640 [Hyphomicrobiaceae bacterium]|nr:hypothetical protein [Hyphomicrobiaceae bacterium]